MKKAQNRSMAWIVILSLFLMAGPLAARTAQAATQDFGDLDVLEAVEKELIADPGVLLNNIDVTVAQGIVTLSGTVNNILAKDRATRVAETVKGVRSVVNRIEVDPVVVRSDMELARDVEDALLMNAATESYEIRVSSADGMVTLRGTVDSWKERRLAGIVAKGVRGVTGLENQIEVIIPEERTDPEIREEVQKALRWDELVDHVLIDVRVNEGHVTLSGVVGSAAEKRKALIDAHVTGVKSVDGSQLEVKYWARNEDLRKDKYVVKSDQAVHDAVEDALMYDPRVSGLDVTTRVEDGIVTLRGNVDDLMEKQAAEHDALNTVGVLSVKNRLRVRPDEPVQDWEVEQRANAALTRDPYLEPYEITVEVTGGTASLYGEVDSYFEKTQAEDVVSSVEGIWVVDNKIRVDYHRDYLTFDPYVDDRYLSDYDWYRPEPVYPKMDDAKIEDEIKGELWWSPFVDSDDVEVTVNNGRVTLTGEVDSWSEYSAAGRNAYEGGATWVDNDLEVVMQ